MDNQTESTTYKISGIHCNACVALINMELEEAGLGVITLNTEKQTLLVPQALSDQIQDIRKALAKAGEYSIQQIS
ncbi:hypothetical protein GW793_00645 [bacterium]|uniref:Uncharacterized protein n=2 Tax=Katanobacteria TaxID=422282 RepID=A0A2M7X0T8_UNCKA|nr:hypothetical protein [bacterium]PIP56679.1 MAG: hypothetical protein COX05_01760 [candidate division WWE3 bacterium CG22_combo_CG10-13_8_21_14_all_39_12]PJA39786.1 MAG: hypothetical protein CO179_04450 [candidate division WWE3 bacterium CG_4_9_14_3_um_filter_39_7]